jgi:hypothetical protein
MLFCIEKLNSLLSQPIDENAAAYILFFAEFVFTIPLFIHHMMIAYVE